MKEQKKSSKIKKWFLAIGIAIIFALFVNYGIATFFNAPRYDDFCKQPEGKIINWTPESCAAHGGQWTSNTAVEKYEIPVAVSDKCSGWCNQDYTCSKLFEEKRKDYDGKAFIVTIIAGFLGLIAGISIGIESLSAGALLGGVLNIFIATVRYWERFQDWMRFILLGIVLIVLIWIAYKKIK